MRGALPGSDVVVHVEPLEAAELRERALAAALGVPRVREVHNLSVLSVGGRTEVSLHLKLPGDLPLDEAHSIAEEVERAICAAVPEVEDVQTPYRAARRGGRRPRGRGRRGCRRAHRPRDHRLRAAGAPVPPHRRRARRAPDARPRLGRVARDRPRVRERGRAADPRRPARDRRRRRAHRAVAPRVYACRACGSACSTRHGHPLERGWVGPDRRRPCRPPGRADAAVVLPRRRRRPRARRVPARRGDAARSGAAPAGGAALRGCGALRVRQPCGDPLARRTRLAPPAGAEAWRRSSAPPRSSGPRVRSGATRSSASSAPAVVAPPKDRDFALFLGPGRPDRLRRPLRLAARARPRRREHAPPCRRHRRRPPRPACGARRPGRSSSRSTGSARSPDALAAERARPPSQPRETAPVLELPPDEMRRLGYRAVDRLVDHLEGLRELPPIRTVDPADLPWLLEPCPEEPSDPDDGARPRVRRGARLRHAGEPSADVRPHRQPVELRGRARAARRRRRQRVLRELAERLRRNRTWSSRCSTGCAAGSGSPQGTEGILVSGGSLGNLTALAAAAAARDAERPRATGYVSDQTHATVERAWRVLGFDPAHLRVLASDERQRLPVEAVRAAVAGDRDAGLEPFVVVATAGTTSTGRGRPAARARRPRRRGGPVVPRRRRVRRVRCARRDWPARPRRHRPAPTR